MTACASSLQPGAVSSAGLPLERQRISSPRRVLTKLDRPSKPEQCQLLQRPGRALLALEAGQVTRVLAPRRRMCDAKRS